MENFTSGRCSLCLKPFKTMLVGLRLQTVNPVARSVSKGIRLTTDLSRP